MAKRVTEGGKSNVAEGRPEPSPVSSRSTPAPHSLTVTGQILGSPNFMPPEQLRGCTQEVGVCSDVYGLGAILYHLLTARPPFLADTLPATLEQVAGAEPVAPRTLNPGVPRDLETVCLKCLEKQPAKRYATAGDLALELQRFERGEPIHARPIARTEKLWRWARRKPALAGLAASLLLLAVLVGVGSPVALVRIERERRRAEATVTRLEIQRAEELLGADDVRGALARLGRVLRDDPANLVAAQRVLSILCEENFPLPLTGDLQHSGRIRAGVFSPDGRSVATGSDDSTVRIWDTTSGRPLTPTLLHEGRVSALDYSADGRSLVSGASDGVVRVWDTSTGQLRSTTPRHGGAITSVRFSPDGKLVLAACANGVVRLSAAQTGQFTGILFKHEEGVTGAEFSPDGHWVLTASMDDTARVWNAHTGEPRGKPMQHSRAVAIAHFSPDGKLVATGSHDSTARIWEAATGRPVTAALRHDNWVSRLAFSPDGERLVTGTVSASMNLWNARTGQALRAPFRLNGGPTQLAFIPDGERFVVASSDRLVRLFDATTGQLAGVPLKHAAEPWCVAVSRDGQRLLTAADNGMGRVWNIRSGQPAPMLLRHSWKAVSAAFSRDGRWVCTTARDCTARVWDALTGAPKTPPLKLTYTPKSLAFDPSGERLLVATLRGGQIWDVASARRLALVGSTSGDIGYPAFHPNGELFVSRVRANKVTVWNTRDGAVKLDRQWPGKNLKEFAFSPDGTSLAVGTREGDVFLCEVATGALRFTRQQPAAVHQLRFRPDGRQLAVGDGDGRIWIVDAVSGQPIMAPLQHEAAVDDAQFSPDGTRLAVSTFEGALRVWDLRTGRSYTALSTEHVRAFALNFSDDGTRVVMGSFNGTAVTLDAATGQVLGRFVGHTDMVWSSTFSPEGRTILTSAADGMARLWPVAPNRGPAPGWLADFAEALAGHRLDEEGEAQLVPMDRLLEMRQRVLAARAPDDWSRWVQWFFSDRSTRTVSPSTPLTLPDYVARLIAENAPESLRLALSIDPTNSIVLAKLALQSKAPRPSPSSETSSPPAPGGLNRDSLLDRAEIHDPEGSAVLWAKARRLQEQGKWEEALGLMEQAAESGPTEPEFWENLARLYYRAGQIEQAVDACTTGLDFAADDAAAAPWRARLHAQRSAALRRLDRLVEAAQDKWDPLESTCRHASLSIL